MEDPTPEANNNIIELKEEKEDDPNKKQKPNQTPTRHLRDIKKVNYSKFFSEDQDNSEEYEPDEKIEIAKKRPRPKSVSKSHLNTIKKENEEDKNTENKMEIEENEKNNNNKIVSGYGHIINIDGTLLKYSTSTSDSNPDNINITNSDLILILLELCLNSRQFGLEKDNSSRLFWEEVGKIEKLKPITSKFKTETLRKYWRILRETKKYKKLISETKRYANELNNSNLKLLSSIRVICEYVSSPSKRRIEHFLDKHTTKPASKSKKINVNDMPPSEQIAEIINTFKKCFPKKKEKDIINTLLQTSFDIENTYLVLKDRENLGILSYSEKDDEIVKRNYEDNDDKNKEYQELIHIKGLEDVIRRKEFLFDVKIDRSQYISKVTEEANNKNLGIDDDKNKDKNNNDEVKEEKNKDKETIDGNKDEKKIDKGKEKEKENNIKEKDKNIS